MAIHDVRCKDVARILSTGPKTIDEIGDIIHKIYPGIDPKGKWVREVLTKWNPLVVERNGRFELSDLGRALISLPGREGEEPTLEEKIFLIGIMMMDKVQRKIIGELITTGASKHSDNWTVNRTKECLKKIGLI